MIRIVKKSIGKKCFQHAASKMGKEKRIDLRKGKEENVVRKEGVKCHNKKDVGKY